LAFLLDPAWRRLAPILKHGDDSHALAAINEVLARNELYGYGVEPKGHGFGQNITVQTQVNMPEARVASLSDQELATYDKLLSSCGSYSRRTS
jgi:hypothetical protein